MATLTVEGVPDLLLARLERLAAAHGRCVNGELIALLARELAPAPAGPLVAAVPRAARVRVGWGGDAAGA